MIAKLAPESHHEVSNLLFISEGDVVQREPSRTGSKMDVQPRKHIIGS
jgi:hypothetical protein